MFISHSLHDCLLYKEDSQSRLSPLWKQE